MSEDAQPTSGDDEIEASRRALQVELKAAGAHIDEVGRVRGAEARAEKIAEEAAAHSAQLAKLVTGVGVYGLGHGQSRNCNLLTVDIRHMGARGKAGEQTRLGRAHPIGRDAAPQVVR